MTKLDQTSTPIADALARYHARRVVPFDVPGHKQGKGNVPLRDFLGEKCLSIDVNSMKPLDNLSHPTGVILHAEQLAAQAFGADHAFFIVNGTTASVQAMIMSCCKLGDKIILPRNVHRSALNALTLCGAVPVYVNPGIHPELGISLGMELRDTIAAMNQHPDAKAVLINNPTYYGICSDIKRISQEAHKRGMLVLADEAHGTHFYFGDNLPPAAMHVGADMAAVSIHKTGGSLTQSSMLLVSTQRIRPEYVRTVINLTQTTSASYLLLSSLDISRKNLALNGSQIFSKVLELTQYARAEINDIGVYYAFGSELIDGGAVYDFDATKLCVHTLELGLAGIEVYDILRDEYGIQLEFGDLANFLAVISVGDNSMAIERLVAALTEIKRLKARPKQNMIENEYITPIVATPPHSAFYATKHSVTLDDANGKTSGEFVMCYPPGIPILAPGEVVTQEIIEYIRYAKQKGSLLTGAEDMTLQHLYILEE